MNDLAAFLRARVDEDEQAVKNRTCINCGRPTAPVRNALGITGYTHHGEWEGQRCPGRLTGAEPVQNPARVLREAEGKRRIVDEIARGVEYEAEGLAEGVLAWLALPYADHPDYRQEWRA